MLSNQKIGKGGQAPAQNECWLCPQVQRTSFVANGRSDDISKKNYLSHEIINEQIEIIAHSLLSNLLEKIRMAKYFAIIGDETLEIYKWQRTVCCI